MLSISLLSLKASNTTHDRNNLKRAYNLQQYINYVRRNVSLYVQNCSDRIIIKTIEKHEKHDSGIVSDLTAVTYRADWWMRERFLHSNIFFTHIRVCSIVHSSITRYENFVGIARFQWDCHIHRSHWTDDCVLTVSLRCSLSCHCNAHHPQWGN